MLQHKSTTMDAFTKTLFALLLSFFVLHLMNDKNDNNSVNNVFVKGSCKVFVCMLIHVCMCICMLKYGCFQQETEMTQ